MNIRPAVDADANVLSALAMRAKSHWGYSVEALENWHCQLTVSKLDIRTRPTFAAVMDGRVAGFYSLCRSARSWDLDHLWVLPEFMHRGIGRALFSHAMDTAARGGAREITV